VGSTDPIAPLLRLSPEARARLDAALAPVTPSTGDATPEPRTLRTPFGGLLLLLPHLAELPLDAMWPLPDERAFGRLNILAHCAGAARAPRVLADPLIRLLAGVPDDADDPDPAPDEPARSFAHDVLRGFARRLPGFVDSSPEYLYDNFLDFEATVEETGTRRICRMGHPPLGALLLFTGALRGRIAVPWLGDPPLELFTGG
jgi:hypothetical protein